tara:strand:- start:17308 stop:18030 length:723 start_codon:yes stop_codon:yes gene_type:complete
MTDDPSQQNGKLNSSVNLVRSSHSWTEADSAAGFVLRYLTPMRRQLTEIMGSTKEADESLKLLLSHLVTAGFGEHRRGRLRDFLVRGVRSCAKARVAEIPEAERPNLNLDEIKLDSKTWLQCWRDCLLERAWRALERHQHTHPETFAYTVLKSATDNPKALPDELFRIVKKQLAKNGRAIDTSHDLDVMTVGTKLAEARALFAQLIADEVVETLESPDPDAVKKEINSLGLGRAFDGLGV